MRTDRVHTERHKHQWMQVVTHHTTTAHVTADVPTVLYGSKCLKAHLVTLCRIIPEV